MAAADPVHALAVARPRLLVVHLVVRRRRGLLSRLAHAGGQLAGALALVGWPSILHVALRVQGRHGGMASCLSTVVALKE